MFRPLISFNTLACFIPFLLAGLLLTSCEEEPNPEKWVSKTIARMSLKDRIAQKIILDFRYYCKDFIEEPEKCKEPATQVPAEFSSFLRSHALGGVILFADNIQSIEQTVRLTHEIQRDSMRAPFKVPLFISIDQEGGKVVRLPRHWATSFSGSMAIAATPVDQRQKFARTTGSIMGAELAALGINVNHAPVVDVNTNPENPVINVRSFSDQPEQVAVLAGSMAEGMISSGIIPTLKHFPGHGDTSTDSHLDLPLVDHDRETAALVDLYPFSKLIKEGHAPMIMTAHIQFPALDNTKFITKDGSQNYIPATLSRKILTGLLRGDMGYEGVIVSDAMDMRAISERMTPNDAAVAAFRAGVDLLLMPIVIRSKRDLEQIDDIVDYVADNVKKGVITEQELNDSVRRILLLKQQFGIRVFTQKSLAVKIEHAKKTIGKAEHRTFEKELAAAAITAVKKPSDNAPVIGKDIHTIHVIMPTQELNTAFTQALKKRLDKRGTEIGATLLNALTLTHIRDTILKSDLLITGDVTPAGSPVDYGGMSDIDIWVSGQNTAGSDPLGAPAPHSSKILQRLHREAKTAGKKVTFISLRFPVDVPPLLADVDAAFATYSFDTVQTGDGSAYSSPSIDALVEVLVGDRPALGTLPIKLEVPQKKIHTIMPGAERITLVKEALLNKRVGLIVNQSSLVGDMHLIDALRQEGVNVEKLFAVEHGIRGTADAGATVENSRDSRTDLPIISIYGNKKAPSKQDVEGLDVLVFDLQDVGVRFYTYLSSLHYTMESCAQNNTPLLVLDRPNPNGAFIDGPILDPIFKSFVGMHPIPVLHGMTLGELAKMINGEGWLSNGATCDLTVIPLQNYTHSLEYHLPIKPSPNLPNQKSIQLYPSLALFEATNVSVGRGTEFPFQVLGGTRPEYGKFTFMPVPTPGAALNPKLKGRLLYGSDFRQSNISGLTIEVFIDWYRQAQDLKEPFLTRPNWLDKLMGTDRFRHQLEAGLSAADIRASWQKDIDIFKKRRALYLLYSD